MSEIHDHEEIRPSVNPETLAEVFPHTAPDGRALDATGLVEGCEGCAYLATYYGDSDATDEDWRQTPVRDLAVGDVVEAPGSEASWTVKKHDRAGERDWFNWEMGDFVPRSTSGGTLVWKLFKNA